MGCGMSRYGMVDVVACGLQPSRKKIDEAPHRNDIASADAQNSPKCESPPRKSVSMLEPKGENEEDGGRLSSYDGAMWINSLSFRDYCHHESDSEDNNNNKDGGHSDDEKDQSSPRGGNGNSSPESSEAAESKASKKAKGSAFSRVLPKGTAVKHFLHAPGHHHNQGTKVPDSHDKHGKPVEKVD